MKRIGLHFPRFSKFGLWLLILVSWASGAVWFSLHRWVRVAGEFGDEHSPWEAILIRIHGGSAMLIMVYYGYLLGTHVTVGLRARRNRFLGLALVAVVGFQIVTAYGLYYIGGEQFREYVSWAHLCVGLSIPLLLLLHIFTGHRSAKK